MSQGLGLYRGEDDLAASSCCWEGGRICSWIYAMFWGSGLREGVVRVFVCPWSVQDSRCAVSCACCHRGIMERPIQHQNVSCKPTEHLKHVLESPTHGGEDIVSHMPPEKGLNRADLTSSGAIEDTHPRPDT